MNDKVFTGNHRPVCDECWIAAGMKGKREVTLGLVSGRKCTICDKKIDPQNERKE